MGTEPLNTSEASAAEPCSVLSNKIESGPLNTSLGLDFIWKPTVCQSSDETPSTESLSETTAMSVPIARRDVWPCQVDVHLGTRMLPVEIANVDDGQTFDEVQTLNPEVQPFVPRAALKSSSDRQAPAASSLPLPTFDGDPTNMDMSSPSAILQNPVMSAAETSTPCRDSTVLKNGPDVLSGSQTDACAKDQHPRPACQTDKAIRLRKKPAHLANYVCTIKVDSVGPKKAMASKTKSRVFASRDVLPLEGPPKGLANSCCDTLPDALKIGDAGQTVTTLSRDLPFDRGGKKADCTISRTNSYDHDLCSRSVSSSAVMEDQLQCKFCHVVGTENGIRRHILLQHRHQYRRYEPPVYIVDDALYARMCEHARRNQCHRRTVARQRAATTDAELRQHVPRPSAAPPDTDQPRRRRQSQPQAAAGALTENGSHPVAKKPPDKSISGNKKGRARPKQSSSLPTPRLERPSSEGLHFDQYVKATRFNEQMRVYEKQCARDRRMREEQSSSDSDSYDFKRGQQLCLPEVAPSFHVASRDVEPEGDDAVLAANLPMLRTVYQSGSCRSVLHIDDIGSQARCDTLDEFLLENGIPADASEVPGMSTLGAAGLGFTGSALASPGDEWEPQAVTLDPDIRAASTVTSCSGAVTSEPPVTVLPVGIFPVDVIDVVFEHPGVEVSVLTEMLLARTDASTSGQHRANAKALLNVAVLSSRRAVDAIILQLQSLRDGWNADESTRAGDTAMYQEAVHAAVAAYRREMSCNPRI